MAAPAPDTYFAHLLERSAAHIERFRTAHLEGIGLSGLGPSHGDLLFLLARRGPQSMREIASAIHRDKSTVTALVRKLESTGLLEREQDARDARVTRVTLTARGRRLRRPLLAGYEHLHRRLAGGLRSDEIETLHALLKKVYLSLEGQT